MQTAPAVGEGARGVGTLAGPALRKRPRPAAARCSASGGRPGGTPNHPPGAALTRKLLRAGGWRSAAQAADVDSKLQVPDASLAASLDQQQANDGVASAAQLDGPGSLDDELEAEEQGAHEQQQGSYTASLYAWLGSWVGRGSGSSSSSSSSIDLASSSMDVMELGDGMAASVADVGGQPSPKRGSWYNLRRGGSRASGGAGGRVGGRVGSSAPAAPAAVEEVYVDHPALQLLRARVQQGSKPGRRQDGFKLGLVVEGGGMRGCVSGGSLQALGDLGLRDCFDAVYGSSAGAINATYFLTGQRDGVEIYHEKIACEEFISLPRLWKAQKGRRRPVLNLDFLIDHVMNVEHPLNWQGVLDSPVPLKVVASSLDSLKPVILENFSDAADLALSLKASAHVPEIAGSAPVEHRGQQLVDAAVFEPIPFRSAIADGCTHVLVLGTRPKPAPKGRLNMAAEDVLEAVIKRAVMSPDYMRAAWKAEMDYLDADGISQDQMLLRSLEEGSEALPWFAGAHVYPVYPGTIANFSPLCTDVPSLKAGIAEGRRAVLAVLRLTLADLLDFPAPAPDSNNIQPLPRAAPRRRSDGSMAGGSPRLWRRELQEADFSHH